MMNAGISFRRPLGDIPPRYRTPSPPREAHEPLSPGGHVVYNNWQPEHSAHTTHGLGLSLGALDTPQQDSVLEQQLWVDGNGQARIDPFNANSARSNTTRRNTYDDFRTSSRNQGSQKRDRKVHTRSGSNIDALATIALATSPTFSQGSPSFAQSPWTSYNYTNGYQHDFTLDERPSKRARSEKLPSPQMGHQHSRPSTSHVTSLESLKDDAELLLNFAQPHNFPPIANSTPQQGSQIDQESPPFKRLSASTIETEKMEQPAPSGTEQDRNSSDQAPHDHDPLEMGKTIPESGVGDGLLVDTKQAAGNPEKAADSILGDSALYPTENQLSATLQEQLVAAAETTRTEEKKARRIQPTTQAPCAKCNSLQATIGSEDQDGLTSWIGCNGCQKWFHIVCAGFKDSREVRTVDKYICPDCEPVKGQTTYVRKSSRARTAIDYAGLNQGMVQSSEQTAEHHWLKPIKDGKIKFQPDDFARIRPELLTEEFLERTDGMKRPVVIPACWNHQFGVKGVGDTSKEGSKTPAEPGMIIDSSGDEVSATLFASSSSDQEDVIDCGQDLLDMVMPQNLTVRRVAELHGLDMPLDVIDVKSQQTAQKWNLEKWADYYESTGEKTIRNVISLEVSQSKLGRLLQRPKIVRDLDLQDAVWPPELPSKAVQFYCLMSVADCYTDFHIDFGGSSVYYHILKGKKTFFFIPPEEKHLRKYEQWNNSPLQNQTFLGDVTGDCSRVDLSEGDTMMIPSGWIHAVWTPENSLVVGGNFLTRMNYEMQIKVNRIEIDTKTALKFRYPLFQKVNWYAAIRYLEDDPVPEEVLNDFEDDPDYVFLRANPVWHEFGGLENDAEPGDPFYNHRFYSRMEMEGLPALRDYLYRTALIASDFHVDGVTETARTNVKKSIPKGHGEPMDLIRSFGIWVAWKTGCVVAPDWVRPDSPSLSSLARKAEKQKKSDVMRTPGERVSTRVQSQLEQARAEIVDTASKQQASSVEPETVKEETKRPRRTPKTSGLGPQRFACDPCRKRRIRCRHREGELLGPASDSGKPRTQSSTSVDSPRPVPSQSFMSFDGPPSSPQANIADTVVSSNLTSTPLPPQEPNGFDKQPTPVPTQMQDSTMTGTSSSKKGRSKACEECRKSKRRCIHDENGKVDPFKAAEPSKPRGSTSTKRPARLSDDIHASAKRSKGEDGENDTLLVGQARSARSEAFNEQAIEEDDFNSLIDPSLRPAIQQLQAAADAMTQSAHEMNEAAGPDLIADHTMNDIPREVPPQPNLTVHIDPQLPPSPSIKTVPHPAALTTTSSSQISANSLVSPPDSLRNDNDNDHDETFSPTSPHPEIDMNMNMNKSIDAHGEASSSSSISIDSTTSNRLQTPKSTASRHSSRQPKPVDRYVPNAGEGGGGGGGGGSTKQPPHPSSAKKQVRRASSSGGSVGTSSNEVSNPGGEGRKSRRASSHATTSPIATSLGFGNHVQQHQHQQASSTSTSPSSSSSTAQPAVTAATARPVAAFPAADLNREGRGAAAGVGAGPMDPDALELGADEESLRLIRALQEEEFGLRRRRSGMRA